MVRKSPFTGKTSELIAEFKNSGMRSDYDVAYIQYEDNVAKANFTEYDNTILLMDERPLKGKYQTLPGENILLPIMSAIG